MKGLKEGQKKRKGRLKESIKKSLKICLLWIPNTSLHEFKWDCSKKIHSFIHSFKNNIYDKIIQRKEMKERRKKKTE